MISSCLTPLLLASVHQYISGMYGRTRNDYSMKIIKVEYIHVGQISSTFENQKIRPSLIMPAIDFTSWFKVCFQEMNAHNFVSMFSKSRSWRHHSIIIIRNESLYRLSYGFEFTLELICTSEFFKNLKLHGPFGECSFSFLKNSQLQINSKLKEKNRMITY